MTAPFTLVTTSPSLCQVTLGAGVMRDRVLQSVQDSTELCSEPMTQTVLVLAGGQQKKRDTIAHMIVCMMIASS